MTDLEDVTAELRAVRSMLAVVVQRLDDADHRANRNRMWTFLLAVSVLGASLTGAWFVQDSRHERDRICDAMRGGFGVYTDALIASTEQPRSEADQNERDEQIREFRSRVAAGLAGCA